MAEALNACRKRLKRLVDGRLVFDFGFEFLLRVTGFFLLVILLKWGYYGPVFDRGIVQL